MPIDAETFLEGDEWYSIESEITAFLKANGGKAYTLHEITAAVAEAELSDSNPRSSDRTGLPEGIIEAATVSAILDKLVNNGGAERRIVDIDGEKRVYYRSTAPTT